MYIKRLFIVLAASLGLILTMLYLLTGPGRAAPATPTIRCVAPGGTGCAGPCQGTCHAAVQAAVDAAAPGDEIRVAAGTYTGVQARSGMTQVVYISQTVAIRGGYTTTNWTAPNPIINPTTLEAQGQGGVVSIIDDVSPTLEGLRITGGSTDYGGGIRVMNAHPVISGCQVYNNTAKAGGGLYLYPGLNATLTGNDIYSNTATTASGGGVYLYNSDNVTLVGNNIYSNTAWNAGGVYLGNSANATVMGNRIYDNRVTIWHGGGMLISVSHHARLVRNWVYRNTIINGVGGGVALADSSDAILADNVVVENRVTGSGRGAGIYMENSDAQLVHMTLARNTGGDGSGIHITNWVDRHSIATLTNTILVSHTIGITVTAGSTATLEATLWGVGAWANNLPWGGGSHILTGAINIWQGPDFANPAVVDYHLAAGSAAINRGVFNWVTTDIDGEPRVGAPDLGADEYVLQVYLPLTLRSYLAGE